MKNKNKNITLRSGNSMIIGDQAKFPLRCITEGRLLVTKRGGTNERNPEHREIQ